MSRSVRNPDYRPPAPIEYRIEWTGNLQVHVPINPKASK